MYKNWWFKSFLIPLAVGILTALFSSYFQNISSKGKQITYAVEGPSIFLEPTSNSSPEIIIDGTATKEIFGHKVHIWNSGSEPVENLSVLFNFQATSKSFKIFCVTHKTTPTYQFGKINKEEENFNSMRYTYELINEDDEFVVNFLSNGNYTLNAWPRLKGLKIIQASQIKTEEKTKKLLWIIVPSLILFLLTALCLALWQARKFSIYLSITLDPKGYIEEREAKIDQQIENKIKKTKEKFKLKISKNDKKDLSLG